ncbi:MAG: TetR/AcrR family transcriptional regulator [Saprospiraceae bacterium]|nr:TetR/AcrR family transcriptional regulator [Saprospiraceae bacterium]
MCPRRKEQVEEIRSKSINQILAAALDLFAHKGFHNTTISQIAKKAAISKGLIYNYFASKEDLLGGIIDQAMETGEEIMDTIKNPNLDPQQALEKSIDDVFAMIESNPTYWKLLMALSFQEDILKQFEFKLRKQEFKNLEHLTDLVRKMGVKEPQLEAMYLSALLDGVLLHYIHFQDHYPLHKMKELLKAKTKEIGNH